MAKKRCLPECYHDGPVSKQYIFHQLRPLSCHDLNLDLLHLLCCNVHLKYQYFLFLYILDSLYIYEGKTKHAMNILSFQLNQCNSCIISYYIQILMFRKCGSTISLTNAVLLQDMSNTGVSINPLLLQIKCL